MSSTLRADNEPDPAAAGIPGAVARIDCDVHCAPATMTQLEPYLSAYWRDYIDGSGIRLNGLRDSYPPGAPTSAVPEAAEPGPAVPSTLEVLTERFLTPSQPAYAILNCLTTFESHRHPYYAVAVASAINDWLRFEWLDRDDRLRASIAVSPDPEDAVAELERLEDDKRFVQVLLPIRADAPYGNKRYHRLYDAAAERGLVIGLHAWGRSASAPTPNALTLTYPEDYLSNQIIVRNHVLSLVSEGVFDRFPTLRVALLECGFAWLPPLLWRFDKDWKGLWREVPWVREKPSVYVRRHFRATTAPAHLPPDPGQISQLLEMVGTEWLLYASDYPHNHGGSADALYDLLDDDDSAAVLHGNAAALYRFDGQPGQLS